MTDDDKDIMEFLNEQARSEDEGAKICRYAGKLLAMSRARSAKLRAAAERIRVLGEAIDEIAKEEDGGYGIYCGGDPRKFIPDEESCTPKELADHKAACEKWNEAEAKGEKMEPEPCGCGWISPTVHVTRSAYGLGTYTYPTNAARLAMAARAATDAARRGA